MGSETIDELLSLTADASTEISREAGFRLMSAAVEHPEALPKLVQSLGSENRWTRYCAAGALAALGSISECAVSDLARLARDKGLSETDRAHFGNCLGIIGGSAIPLIAEMLDEDDEFLRECAPSFFRTDRSREEVVAHLIANLQNTSRDARRATNEFLSGCIRPPPVQELRQACHYPNMLRKAGAALALSKLGIHDAEVMSACAECLRSANEDVQEIGLMCASKAGEAAAQFFPRIPEILKSGNSDVIYAALDFCIELTMSMDPIKDKLVEFSSSPSVHIRIQATELLGRMSMPDRQIIMRLIALLDDEDSTVVLLAANALGQYGSGAREALPNLESLIANCDAETASVAARSISWIRGD